MKINDSIQNAIPTDGLWDDGRSDLDQLGLNYDQIEWAMDKIESKESINEMSEEESRIMKIYLKYNNQNQHKMNTIPICEIPKELLT